MPPIFGGIKLDATVGYFWGIPPIIVPCLGWQYYDPWSSQDLDTWLGSPPCMSAMEWKDNLEGEQHNRTNYGYYPLLN